MDTCIDEEAYIEVILSPKEGKEYYTTTWTHQVNDRYFTTYSNTFSYVGKHLRDIKNTDGDNWSLFLNLKNEEVNVFIYSKTAFYEVESITDITCLKIAEPIEVVSHPQEGRYYYLTDFTEKIRQYPGERYFTLNKPLRYLGKYIGGRSEGWGRNQKEWSHFYNDEGNEFMIEHNLTTAFYHKVFQSIPKIVKELVVLRTPVVGKYYEATFWDRKEGHWSNERYFIKDTTNRVYAGKFLRNRSEGWGDGADHWAIFLRDGKEVEIEYDYDGKRAWYEVEARN